MPHGNHHKVAVAFLDEAGTKQPTDGERYGSLVRFTDTGGRRREIGDSEGPRQVADDSDLADPAG